MARPGQARASGNIEHNLNCKQAWGGGDGCLAYSTASCISVQEARPTAAVGAPISQVGAVKMDPDTL